MSQSTPYYTPWSKQLGSTEIERWVERVESGSAKGRRCIVRYKNKKGKIQECTAWVKWEN